MNIHNLSLSLSTFHSFCIPPVAHTASHSLTVHHITASAGAPDFHLDHIFPTSTNLNFFIPLLIYPSWLNRYYAHHHFATAFGVARIGRRYVLEETGPSQHGLIPGLPV
jgi:hypothetical protein